MHDKRHAHFDTPNPNERTLESLIVDLESSDPAAAPDIAERIAARLEVEIGAASDTTFGGERGDEQLAFDAEAADAL